MYDTLEVELQNRVSKQLEYWSGTMHERLIQRAMDNNDTEALKYHVTEAEREYAMQEDTAIIHMPFMNSALVNLNKRYGRSDA